MSQGTKLEWKAPDPFEVVNQQGTTVTSTYEGETVFLRVRPNPDGSMPPIPNGKKKVEVSIRAATPQGTGESIVSLPVLPSYYPAIRLETDKPMPGEIIWAQVSQQGNQPSAISKGVSQSVSVVSRASMYLILLPLAQNIFIANAIADEILNKKKRFIKDIQEAEEIFKKRLEEVVTSVCQQLEEERHRAPASLGGDSSMFGDPKASIINNVTAQVRQTYQAAHSAATAQKEFAVSLYNIGQLLKRLVLGRLAFSASGDIKGVVENGTAHAEQPYLFDFTKERAAVICVPGMQWNFDQTKFMEASCNYSFGVHQCARIRNYTPGNLLHDVAQSIFSELDAIDPHAVATAVAISEGVQQKGAAYVVAHSQGTEITKSAFEFIDHMSNIAPIFRKMMFETDVLRQLMRLVDGIISPIIWNYMGARTSSLAAGGTLDQKDMHLLTDLFDATMAQLKFVPKQLLLVGELDEQKKKKIFYQGFGSETYIHDDLYGIAYARNVRAERDPVPTLGTIGKAVRVFLDLKDLRLKPNGTNMGKLHNTLTGIGIFGAIERTYYIHQQHWESVKSPSLRDDHGVFISLTAHDWLFTYWNFLQVPPKNGDIPNTQLPFTKSQMEKLRNGETALVDCRDVRPGGSCIGTNKLLTDTPTPLKKTKECVIVLAFDGHGNISGSQSNVEKIAKSANKLYTGNEKGMARGFNFRSCDALVSWDPEGVRIGKNAVNLLKEGMVYLAQNCKTALRLNHQIIIDLYGFGRGASIANQLAWIIHEKGIICEGELIVQPNTTDVRFLGLFDALYEMSLPDENIWHVGKISPNVIKAVHAFAGQEYRRYCPILKMNTTSGRTLLKNILFPGVARDVGGNLKNFTNGERNIMTLVLSCMADELNEEGIEYMTILKRSAEFKQAIASNPKYITPGDPGFPDHIFDIDLQHVRNREEIVQDYLDKKNAEMAQKWFEIGYWSEKLALHKKTILPGYLTQKPYKVFSQRSFNHLGKFQSYIPQERFVRI